MNLCFIADARSPIAQSWIDYFIGRGHKVTIISTYPVGQATYLNASLYEVTSKLNRTANPDRNGHKHGLLARLTAQVRAGQCADLIFTLQHRAEECDISRRTKILGALLREIRPDLVHAMRLPFEGIMAARAEVSAPLVVSIWGNDLTLFARRFPWTRRESVRALRRVDALHCDCQRDLKLAGKMGFDTQKPSLVLPGCGGVQIGLFGRRCVDDFAVRRRFDIPDGVPLICNPRGFRAYVRNDTFFRSVARVSKTRPDIVFAAVGMQGHPIAERWISTLGIHANVRLLPTLSRNEMAALLRTSDVMVSPSEHDGTPNTLLESMAAGAFPIAGDIESVAEWIQNGVNGSLMPPSDPNRCSQAILDALANPALLQSAALINRRLIEERAEYTSCMAKAGSFYHQLAQGSQMKAASGF
jgi:glycosyltransferase involved in cell wall biosynthesis